MNILCKIFEHRFIHDRSQRKKEKGKDCFDFTMSYICSRCGEETSTKIRFYDAGNWKWIEEGKLPNPAEEDQMIYHTGAR